MAGTGVQGFAGDGGPATAAQLSIPFGVAPTADGGFLIVDVGNQRIRKVSADRHDHDRRRQRRRRLQRRRRACDSGESCATRTTSSRSHDGSFLIADASNQRVRTVAADGIIDTLIGDGTRGYTGDGGPAAAAQLSVPKAVARHPGRRRADRRRAEQPDPLRRHDGRPGERQPADRDPGTPAQGQQLTATAGGWSGTGPRSRTSGSDATRRAARHRGAGSSDVHQSSRPMSARRFASASPQATRPAPPRRPRPRPQSSLAARNVAAGERVAPVDRRDWPGRRDADGAATGRGRERRR